MSGSNNKTKCLNNSFLDFSNVVAMQIIESVIPNPNDANSTLSTYGVVAITDFDLKFEVFEDLDSGVDTKCKVYINDNWKCKNKVEIAGKNIWLDLDKIIATKVTEGFEVDPNDKRKILYVAKLFAITSFGFNYEMASYIRPKGENNNLIEIDKFRLKYLK